MPAPQSGLAAMVGPVGVAGVKKDEGPISKGTDRAFWRRGERRMWRRRSDSAARIMGNARRKALISHAAPFGAAGIGTKGEAGISPLGDALPLCRGFSGSTSRLPSACVNRAAPVQGGLLGFPAPGARAGMAAFPPNTGSSSWPPAFASGSNLTMPALYRCRSGRSSVYRLSGFFRAL